jgi:NAD(P)-dependent dehydrogenase (short-subunit alcohol dehydrogenase family)
MRLTYMRFKDKTAIVTGAANGIGRAAALRLAREGAKVAAVDLDREKVGRTAEEIKASGGAALALHADVTKIEEVQKSAAMVLSEFGKIDILINNAGAGWRNQPPSFKDTPIGSWQWIFDLNINGTLFFTHSVIEHMTERKYGRIINVASIAAKVGIPGLAVYSASKGAIVSFTKSLAMELGPHNITVNSVSPGMVSVSDETPACAGTFLERQGAPGEFASVIAFLASDEASFITGADYIVDGGRVLGPRGV